MKLGIAIAIWLFIGCMGILFIYGAGHQKRFERRENRDRKVPSNHDLSASHDLLMLVQIACAACGVVLLFLMYLFGDKMLNLICGV